MSNQGNVQSREDIQRARVFNPNEHLIQLKSRQGSQDYLPVQWRLVWFRSICPQGEITTELVHLDLEKDTEEETFVWNQEKRRSEKVIKTAKGFAIFRATVKDGKGGVATGTGSESAASFGDYIEKAETKSVGRALAALGYGTQFTGDEFNEAHRIVDSPVDRGSAELNGAAPAESNGSAPAARYSLVQNGNGNGFHVAGAAPKAASAKSEETSEVVTEQQISSIRKLCEHMGRAEPENVTSISYLAAKKLIQQLTSEYREYKQSNKAS